MICKQLLLGCWSYYLGLSMTTKCEIRLHILKENTHRKEKKKKKANSKQVMACSSWLWVYNLDLILKSKNWEREIERMAEWFYFPFLLAIAFVT